MERHNSNNNFSFSQYLLLSYRCANSCCDKRDLGVKHKVDTITIWTGTDRGKCENDGQGRWYSGHMGRDAAAAMVEEGMDSTMGSEHYAVLLSM